MYNIILLYDNEYINPSQLIYSRPQYIWTIESLQHQEINKLYLAINNTNTHIFYDIQHNFSFDVEYSIIQYSTRGHLETLRIMLNDYPDLNYLPVWIICCNVVFDENFNWNIDSFIKIYPNINCYGFPPECIQNNNLSRVDDIKTWNLDELIKSIKCDKEYYSNIDCLRMDTQKDILESLSKLYPKPLRWVFDLDQTLVTLPIKRKDYSSVKPINSNVEFLRKLYNNNHYIIIYTARHMKTCQGDVELIKQKVEKVTRNTLQQFNIPYHELHFGKPFGDVYIDDKAFNLRYLSDFGYGWGVIDYKHNKINSSQRKIININEYLCYKIVDKDEANRYQSYIQNMPETLKSYVPAVYRFIEDNNNNNKVKILMEWKHDSIPISQLLVNQLMTDDIYTKIIELIEVIHSYNNNNISISKKDVMQNYFPKFIERYLKFDIYKNIHINIDEIFRFFEKYESSITSCIHGDFWLNNLLFDKKSNDIYMIDMRGSLGNLCTIGGDKYYDYAKLYQSFLGFDNVLYDKKINRHNDIYLDKFKTYLESIGVDCDIVSKIACVLILGSLPFHEEFNNDDDKLGRIENIVKSKWPEIVSDMNNNNK